MRRVVATAATAALAHPTTRAAMRLLPPAGKLGAAGVKVAARSKRVPELALEWMGREGVPRAIKIRVGLMRL